MMRALKNFGWVVLTAILVGLPAAVFDSPSVTVPFWYAALAAVARALGTGVIAVVFGTVVLVARRSHPNGGLKPALVITIVVGVFTSFASIYPLLRT